MPVRPKLSPRRNDEYEARTKSVVSMRGKDCARNKWPPEAPFAADEGVGMMV